MILLVDTTNLPLPIWDDELPICSLRGIIPNYVQAPNKIHRKLVHAQLLPCQLLRHHLQDCQEVVQQLALLSPDDRYSR